MRAQTSVCLQASLYPRESPCSLKRSCTSPCSPCPEPRPVPPNTAGNASSLHFPEVPTLLTQPGLLERELGFASHPATSQWRSDASGKRAASSPSLPLRSVQTGPSGLSYFLLQTPHSPHCSAECPFTPADARKLSHTSHSPRWGMLCPSCTPVGHPIPLGSPSRLLLCIPHPRGPYGLSRASSPT